MFRIDGPVFLINRLDVQYIHTKYLFIDDDLTVSDISLSPPISHSDHNCINFTLTLPNNSTNLSKNHFEESDRATRYAWNRADYESVIVSTGYKLV